VKNKRRKEGNGHGLSHKNQDAKAKSQKDLHFGGGKGKKRATEKRYEREAAGEGLNPSERVIQRGGGGGGGGGCVGGGGGGGGGCLEGGMQRRKEEKEKNLGPHTKAADLAHTYDWEKGKQRDFNRSREGQEGGEPEFRKVAERCGATNKTDLQRRMKRGAKCADEGEGINTEEN